jgi:hypothetical protein
MAAQTAQNDARSAAAASTRSLSLDLWLAKIGADIVPVDADLVDLATQAWLAYGKGRHPARLNFAIACPTPWQNVRESRCCSRVRIFPRPTWGRPVHDIADDSGRTRG